MLEPIDERPAETTEVNTSTTVYTVNVEQTQNNTENDNGDSDDSDEKYPHDEEEHIKNEILFANRLLAQASKHPFTTGTFLLAMVGVLALAPENLVAALEIVVGMVLTLLTVAGLTLRNNNTGDNGCDCSHSSE